MSTTTWPALAAPPSSVSIAKPTPAEIRAGRQMEKDERFWIAGIPDDSVPRPDPAGAPRDLFAERAATVLELAAPNMQDSWEQASVGRPLFLYFEANLTSPPAYRRLAGRESRPAGCHSRISREAAQEAGMRVEGRTTKVDAILVGPLRPRTAVVFEAKVLSDLSTHVSFDATRNQLARIIDVVLDDSPSPAGTAERAGAGPDLCRAGHPGTPSGPNGPSGADRSRLYGWLIPEYKKPDSTLLARHLETPPGGTSAASTNGLGWVTWEQINQVRPGACQLAGHSRPRRSRPLLSQSGELA